MDDNILTLGQQLGITKYPVMIFNNNDKVMYTEFSSQDYTLAIRNEEDKLIGIIFHDGYNLLP
jgi:hypothetical protein